VLVLTIVVSLAAAAAAAPAAGGPVPADRWWRIAAVQSRLQLTPQQVRRVDAIYDASLKTRRPLRKQLDRLQDQLARMLADGAADEARARALVDRLLDVQRQSNVARTMMLIRIYEILDPTQRARLAEIRPRGQDPAASALARRAGPGR
jgi:Spy/CpxP family protein refolding chaperone